MHDLDAEFRGAFRPARAQGLAFHPDLSCIGRVVAGDATNDRRLPCAVVADQPENLAGPDLQINVLERVQAAEGLPKARDAEEGFCRYGHGVHSAGWRWLIATATTMMISWTTICC